MATKLPELIVYVREECHLCEHMLHSLSELQRDVAFTISHVDIDEDESLKALYDTEVPVVILDGEVICFHFFEAESIAESLRAWQQ